MTSQRLTPPLPSLWNSLIPEFLCLCRQQNSNQKNNQRKQKDRGKTADGAFLHGLSFFHKHMAQMTTDQGPWALLSSRMSAPLVAVVVGSFLSPACIIESQEMKGSTYPSTSGIYIRKALCLTALPSSNNAHSKPLFHVTDIYIHMHKDPTSSVSQSFFFPTI